MKKQILIAMVLVLSVAAIAAGGSVYYTYASYAAASVDLETSPTVIFNESCMAPGDVITKKLTVYNRGTLDYDYNVSCSLMDGDLDFFDMLSLEVTNSDGSVNYYSGPLDGLQKQFIGTLAAGYEEDLQFKVTFPQKADNVTALDSSNVNFIFEALEHTCKLPPCGGRVLFEHPIINNQFVLLNGSSIPIKFHLLTQTGEHEQKAREGIILEVVGPNAEGIKSVYTFSLNDPVDTLKWDDNLTDAHYVAVFSTKIYPVMIGGNYRAQVKDNGTILGYIDFKVQEESEANRSNSEIVN